MTRFLPVIGILAPLLASACGSDSPSPTAPAPSTPAEPAPPPETPPPEDLRVRVRFAGPLYLPDTTLHLVVGESLVIPVATDIEAFGPEDAPETVPILVRTNAPATVLSVPGEVRISGSSQPETASVEIRAVPPTSGVGVSPVSEAYDVWLEAEPGARHDWGVDPTRLRIAVTDPTPPPPCGRLALNIRGTGRHWGGGLFDYVFHEVRDYYRSLEITFGAEHPQLSVRLLGQYLEWFDAPDPPFYNAYPTLFAFDFALEETAAGRQQSLELGYFNELRLRAEIPGCEAVEVDCNASGSCRTTRARPGP